jgi:hypothetical protein
MKTKDFIKMLQEEDPTGEGYVRVEGGAIHHVEAKEGYWDGSYKYYDPQTRKLHITTENYKVDVITIDVEDIVWDECGDMEKIRERLVPNYESYADPNQKKEAYDNFWKKVEDEAKDAKESWDILRQDLIDGVIKKYKDGWVCRYIDGDDPFKMKEKQEVRYKSLWFPIEWKKGFKKQSLVLGEVEMIRDNQHLFDKIKKGKYIYFKLK